MTLLLTGASGFVGQRVLHTAKLRGIEVRPVFRCQALANDLPEAIIVPGLEAPVDWSQALRDVDVVIHVAGCSHLILNEVLDPLMEFRRVNVQGTLNLALQAAAAGVRRFVFISSIKVNGEETLPGRPFNAADAPAPKAPYGISKAEAETELRNLAQETGMEVTIIRPPLIYGPGVKGNFASLICWVRRGLPLPLGGVTQNLRSMVGLDNLVDLILLCAVHPKAANQTYLVSDGEDLSTVVLLEKIANALRQPAHLLCVPTGVIAFTASLLGKKAIAQRLLGSLQVDISKTCELLDWRPPVSVDEGVSRAVGESV